MEKVSLVFGDTPSNLLVPYALLGFASGKGFIGIWKHTLQPLCTPCIKPLENGSSLEQVWWWFSTFHVLNKYLEPNGCMVLFHEDSPRVIKNIMSFLENNNFNFFWYWSIVNSPQRSNIKFINVKVNYWTNFNCLIFFFHHSLIKISLFIINYVQSSDYICSWE